jgi:RTX calcium-binding nonapeptide repeat (4 copies)
MRWLGVLVAVLAAPAAAQGSTVTAELRFQLGEKGAPDYYLAHAQVVAAPGETNAIAVRFEDDVVIVDDNASVAPGANCAAIALDEVRCPAPPGSVARVEVDSGDGDDAVSLGPHMLGRVELGPGDDRATATAGASLDGGPDVIRGSAGHDTLYGGSGDDAIDGRGGDDFVVPGPGRDRFVSSGGVDDLYMRDGERDGATCGRIGSVVADDGDLVLHCGRVERPGAGHVTLAASPSSFSGRSLRVHLGCSSDLRRGCVGTVTVRARGRLAGRRRFALKAAEARAVPVALRRFARRSLRDAGRLDVELRVDTRNARGHPVALRARAIARSL